MGIAALPWHTPPSWFAEQPGLAGAVDDVFEFDGGEADAAKHAPQRRVRVGILLVLWVLVVN